MVLSCSIVVHHGFRSKEVKRARKQNIDYGKQDNTPHCWLPAEVMYPTNSTKRCSWLIRSSPIFIVKERPNIYSSDVLVSFSERLSLLKDGRTIC